jgi:hypothetical protein
MTLEATLLTEQKTRKIIELLEGLRRGSPEIPDRQDIEADQTASMANPHEVLAVIEEVMNGITRAAVEKIGGAVIQQPSGPRKVERQLPFPAVRKRETNIPEISQTRIAVHAAHNRPHLGCFEIESRSAR